MDAKLIPPTIAAALVFAAIMTATWAFSRYQRGAPVRRSLALIGQLGLRPDAKQDNLLRQPGTWYQRATQALGYRLTNRRMRDRLAEWLTVAGMSPADALPGVLERKALYATAGASVGLLLAAGPSHAWLWLPGLAIAGFFIPDVLVYNEGLRRTEQIGLTLPDALDLLSLCVDSGLGLQAALAQVAENQQSPVALELARVIQEMQLGMSRHDAFEAMRQRTRQPDLQQFVSAILQVDRLGIPLVTALHEQAREMRAKRRARAQEQAQKVTVKILAPLMLCFMPGMFAIILGPTILTLMKSLASP